VKQFLSGLLCCCLLTTDLRADPTPPVPPPVVTIPATARAKAGRLIKLTATTNCKNLRWINYSPDDADLIPSESGMSAIFSAPVAGSYRVGVFGAAADVPTEVAVCVVTVGDPAPPTPPVPPTPTDPLATALQTAYAAETEPKKAAYVDSLASVFAGASFLLADNQPVSDLKAKLAAAIHDPTQGGLPQGAIPKVSKVITDHLSAQIGTSGTVDKTKALTAFIALSKALGRLK
jgi:hypothetical protein